MHATSVYNNTVDSKMYRYSARTSGSRRARDSILKYVCISVMAHAAEWREHCDLSPPLLAQLFFLFVYTY